MIVMDSKSQLTVDIIAKVAEGKIDVVIAGKVLNKSRRTVERYLQRYRQMGIKCVVHQNPGKASVDKTCDSMKRKVQKLIKKKYFDLNLTHLGEMLLENEGIQVKRETLRSWAHEIHHVKRAKRRRSQLRKRRERMESPGLLLQMDGSTHQWFGEKKSCLIALIDDATSEVHAEFFDAETTLGCLKVLRDYIKCKGVFKTLYVDRAGIFGGPKRCNFSQVKRACEELGIEIIFANSALGKGRIERSFDTFQDRLIPELRLKRIKRMDSANRYLQETFIPDYWKKQIEVNPQNSDCEFTHLPEGTDLNSIFVVKEYRKIRTDHTFSYGNKYYLIDSPLRHSIAKQKIEIHTNHENGITTYFADRELLVSEVIEPTKPSMLDLDIQKKLEVLELAEQLGNVSEAAKVSGVSRDTIYRHRRLIREGGVQALKRQINEDHVHANRTDQETAQAIVEFSLDNPHLGQVQVSNHLKKSNHIDISASGVRQVWLREKMQTMALRMQKRSEMQELL
ncbi:MAG: ISNCY family transposase [Granulosicoccus sp.]